MQQIKLISEIVNPSYLSEYQTWLKSMNQSVRAYPGFISLDIIEPRNQKQLEFLILVRFDSEQSLVNWESEQSTRSMLKLSQKCSIAVKIRRKKSPQSFGLAYQTCHHDLRFTNK
ncbi:hypothetical protein JCM19238_644 [Vibrio ponticus]|nr:hypothetical protein JCM19238_644 [Vibrio ponticus]